jgi:type VI secretion system protein ImpH
MATTGREPSTGLIQELFAHPQRFEFCQAVWLLEAWAIRADVGRAIGGDEAPEREAVRLRARPTLAFAFSEVFALTPAREPGKPALLDTTFFGFVGSAGVMPQHYTALVLARSQARDTALRDFLDIFQHRALSLFYRAARKYRFPAAYLHSMLTSGREDSFTRSVHALVGLGLPALRKRQRIDDAALAFSGGHFARTSRTAASLEQVIEDHFGVQAQVEPFIGRWLQIPTDDRCRLLKRSQRGGVHAQHGGVHAQLGRGAVLGSKVWDVQSRVRLHLGPVDMEMYRHLSPGGAGYHALIDLARSYLGIGIDFDLRVLLASGESGGAHLARSGAPGTARLGRDGWLGEAVGGAPLVGSFCA